MRLQQTWKRQHQPSEEISQVLILEANSAVTLYNLKTTPSLAFENSTENCTTKTWIGVFNAHSALSSLSPEKKRVLPGQLGFCTTVETLGLSVYLKPQWDHFCTLWVEFPNHFSLYSNFAFCFGSLPAPNAAAKLLALGCMWNVEPPLKFVRMFGVWGRCVLPLPVWHMRCGGLAGRVFEGGFRMGGTPQLTSSASQAPGALLCVFLNGIFDWCFQLPRSWPGKGIEEKWGLADINEILMARAL